MKVQLTPNLHTYPNPALAHWYRFGKLYVFQYTSTVLGHISLVSVVGSGNCGWTGGALCFFSFFTQKSKKKPCHKCRSTISLSAGFFCMNTCKILEKKLIKYCSKTSQKCSAPPHHFNYSLKQRQKKFGPTPLLAGCATPCRTKTVEPLVYPPPSDV